MPHHPHPCHPITKYHSNIIIYESQTHASLSLAPCTKNDTRDWNEYNSILELQPSACDVTNARARECKKFWWRNSNKAGLDSRKGFISRNKTFHRFFHPFIKTNMFTHHVPLVSFCLLIFCCCRCLPLWFRNVYVCSCSPFPWFFRMWLYKTSNNGKVCTHLARSSFG